MFEFWDLKRWVVAEINAERSIHGVSPQSKELTNLDLSYSQLIGVDFSYADLDGANLQGANLLQADFRYASLKKANLSEANLEGANLCGATLYKTNLSGAKLRQSDLSGADLYEAKVEGTILDPTNAANNYIRDFAEIDGWVFGWRTKSSPYMGGSPYKLGNTYTAPWFSTCPHTDCHPGLYLFPQLSMAQNFHDSYCYVLVMARAEDIHWAGSKWRTRSFTVIAQLYIDFDRGGVSIEKTGSPFRYPTDRRIITD